MIDYTLVGFALAMISIVLCVVLERLRGDPIDFISRTVEKACYGWFFSLLTGSDNFYFILCSTIAFAFGCSPSWGIPHGAFVANRPMAPNREGEWHWWQYGILRTSIGAAITARAALWALPMLPVCWYFNEGWLAPLSIFVGYIAAFPLSRKVNIRFVTKYVRVREEWSEVEIIRAFVAATLLYTLGYFF